MFLSVGGRQADQGALHFRAQVRRSRTDQMRQGYEALRARGTVRRQQVHIVVRVDARRDPRQGLPEKHVPEPAEADAARRIGMYHIESRHRAAVAGHLAFGIEDHVLCQGHGAQRGTCHV